MSRNSSPGAVATTLPETLEHRLKSYSMAAAAAGVGVLALVHPAEAEVVITHKIIQVPLNGTVSIDINDDGIADFKFAESGGLFPPSGYRAVADVTPLASGAVVGGPISHLPGTYASALKRDVMIGRFKHFVSKQAIIGRFSASCNQSSCGESSRGNWAGNPVNHFLGVKFLIDGETHYGWVRMKVFDATSVVIQSYAYETVADTPICAREVQPCPAPADSEEIGQNLGGPSLGMLALGADGLAVWRREALAF